MSNTTKIVPASFVDHLTDADIASYLLQFAQTAKGAKYANQIRWYVQSGGPRSNRIVSQSEIYAILEDMADILWQHITIDTIESASREGLYNFPRKAIYYSIVQNNDKYDAYVGFDDDYLHRPSLNPKKYPQGIKNIIRLFTFGYHSKNHVYGVWHRSHGDSVHVRSLLHREPNDFMEQAVLEFNREYITSAHAEVLPKYKH